MNCKACGREIPENSIYCNWCGVKQLRERRSREEVKVPTPKQLPSGSWTVYLRAEGQSVTEPTRELCLARARAVRAGFVEARKAAKAAGLTLEQAIDHFVDVNKIALSPSTIRGYEAVKLHRFPHKMRQPITDLTGWQAAVDAEARTLAPKTVRNAWGLVAEVMRENDVTPPRVRLPQKNARTELPWLTYDQILEFVDAVKGSQFETGALLALHSLRRSEIFGLTWNRIDLKQKTITVSGSRVMNSSNQYVFKKTNKNVSSQRTIRIMIPALYDRLKELHDEDKPILACTENSLRGGINTICRKAGLPECGVHGLRRSFASLGFHVGLSELEVQEIGGWNDHNTIHKFYLRLAQADRLNAENKMSEFYRTGKQGRREEK